MFKSDKTKEDITMNEEYVTKEDFLKILWQVARSIEQQDPHFLRRMLQGFGKDE